MLYTQYTHAQHYYVTHPSTLYLIIAYETLDEVELEGQQSIIIVIIMASHLLLEQNDCIPDYLCRRVDG